MHMHVKPNMACAKLTPTASSACANASLDRPVQCRRSISQLRGVLWLLVRMYRHRICNTPQSAAP
jgi:hypothetical protein